MVKKKRQETQEEQSRRLIKTAGESGCDESGETFEQAIRKVATANPPKERKSGDMTWYVAYSPLPGPGARAGQGERLERFLDEAGAKKFVKEIATDPKLRIRAGTLPGIHPLITINPDRAQEWLTAL